MTLLLFAATGILTVIACVLLEERDRAHVIVLVIMCALVVDSLVYPSQGSVPVSLFRPNAGGGEIRFVDALIPAALVARLIVRGLPKRLTGQGLLWVAFFAVYGFGAVVGLANHQSSDLLVFQTKFVVHGGGMAILVAGIPAERWTRRDSVGIAAFVLGLLTLPVLLAAAAGATIPLPLPFLPGASWAISDRTPPRSLSRWRALLVLVELCSNRVLGPAVIAWCLLMLSAPFLSGQRAALIGLGVLVVCVIFVVAGRFWRRRSPLPRVAPLRRRRCRADPTGRARDRVPAER